MNTTQLMVADVSGNGSTTSFDAGMIAKFVAGAPFTPPGIGTTGTWKFTPVNVSYPSVTSSVAGEDYNALLMGEVSGNWTNSAARPAGSGQKTVGGLLLREIVVDLPSLAIVTDGQITIPVAVQSVANRDIISCEFELR